MQLISGFKVIKIITFLSNVIYISRFFDGYQQYNSIWAGKSPDRQMLVSSFTLLIIKAMRIMSASALYISISMVCTSVIIMYESYSTFGEVPNLVAYALNAAACATAISYPIMSEILDLAYFAYFYHISSSKNQQKWVEPKRTSLVTPLIERFGNMVLLILFCYMGYSTFIQKQFAIPITFLVYFLSTFNLLPQYTKERLVSLYPFLILVICTLDQSFWNVYVIMTSILPVSNTSALAQHILNIVVLAVGRVLMFCIKGFSSVYMYIVKSRRSTWSLFAENIATMYQIGMTTVRASIPSESPNSSVSFHLKTFLDSSGVQYHVNPDSWQRSKKIDNILQYNKDDCDAFYWELSDLLQKAGKDTSHVDKLYKNYVEKIFQLGTDNAYLQKSYIQTLFSLVKSEIESIDDEEKKYILFNSLCGIELKCAQGVMQSCEEIIQDHLYPSLGDRVDKEMLMYREYLLEATRNQQANKVTCHVNNNLLLNYGLSASLYSQTIVGNFEDRHVYNKYQVYFGKRFQGSGYQTALLETGIANADRQLGIRICNFCSYLPNHIFLQNNIQELISSILPYPERANDIAMRLCKMVKDDLQSLSACANLLDQWKAMCTPKDDEIQEVEESISKLERQQELTQNDKENIKGIFDEIMQFLSVNNKDLLGRFVLYYYGHIVKTSDIHPPGMVNYAKEVLKSFIAVVSVDLPKAVCELARTFSAIIHGLAISPFMIRRVVKQEMPSIKLSMMSYMPSAFGRVFSSQHPKPSLVPKRT